jgi:hypothetical protein
MHVLLLRVGGDDRGNALTALATYFVATYIAGAARWPPKPVWPPPRGQTGCGRVLRAQLPSEARTTIANRRSARLTGAPRASIGAYRAIRSAREQRAGKAAILQTVRERVLTRIVVTNAARSARIRHRYYASWLA